MNGGIMGQAANSRRQSQLDDKKERAAGRRQQIARKEILDGLEAAAPRPVDTLGMSPRNPVDRIRRT